MINSACNLSVFRNAFRRGAFSPLNLSPSLWLDATDTETINRKNAAQFTTANTEYFSSASTDFDKGDEDFSFGCWFYADNLSGFKGLIGQYDTGVNRSFLLWLTGTTLRATISPDGLTLVEIDVATGLSSGTWYFGVFVYDSVNDLLKGSIDGGTFVTAVQSAGANSGGADLKIGSSFLSNYHQGRIDNAFFYDKALSQSEVAALYNSATGIDYEDLSAAQKTSLVSWWDMNEGEGTRADAVIASGNDLTDNNTVTTAEGKIQRNIQNGEYIYNWNDKSGNGYNFTQATGANQPIYTSTGFGTELKPYLDFDGINDFLSGTTTTLTEATIFVALEYQGATAYQYAYSQGVSTANQHIGIQRDNSDYFYLWSGGTAIAGQNIPINTELIQSVRLNASSVFAEGWQDETKQTFSADYGAQLNAGPNTRVGSFIGSTSFANGKIAEIIVYPTALSDADRLTVTKYLNDKYGVY